MLTIDRITPTQRPDLPVAGYQKWRSLLFMHWVVPWEMLRTLVPAELELDLYAGQAYVGIVPFAMHEIRPSWLPRSFSLNFLEANVRTYVYINGQPGVYFFSLEANSRLAVWAARTGWSLPYYNAHMEMTRTGEEIYFQTRRLKGGAAHHVHYRIGAEMGIAQPETLEHFFIERYLLFVKRYQQLLVGQVYHRPYPLRQAEVLNVHDELLAAAGLAPLDSSPAFTHYSPGVDVEVFGLRPIDLRGGLEEPLLVPET